MHESNSPMSLWDYCMERRVRINNLKAKDNFKLHGTMPHTATWLRRVTYHPFANLDGMNGLTIMNRWLLFPTIVKYMEES